MFERFLRDESIAENVFYCKQVLRVLNLEVHTFAYESPSHSHSQLKSMVYFRSECSKKVNELNINLHNHHFFLQKSIKSNMIYICRFLLANFRKNS